MNGDFQVIHSDALTALRSMESESVQCQICSPPYYGLRSYKTEPQIWDNHNGCGHVWGEQTISVGNAPSSSTTLTGGMGIRESLDQVVTSFCHCGAWRGELGLEPTFQLFLSHLVQIFAEVKRVLKPDGTCFVNLGDSYVAHAKGNPGDGLNGERFGAGEHSYSKINQGIRPKSLMNIPHRFFIAMTDELQMIQRNNINWHKKACMPSSAKDRWTVDFESIGFFSKNGEYKFNQDLEPVSEVSIARLSQPNYENQIGSIGHGGAKTNGMMKAVGNTENRNARTTWPINYEPSGEQHYASYPTKLAEKMILAGTDPGDTVLDIFNGTASTGHAAIRNRRKYIGIELQPDYIAISEKRLAEVQVKLF